MLKARVVAVERTDKFESDRQDLVLLLSLVEDPRALADESRLKETETRGLRSAEDKLALSDPGLAALFNVRTLTRARLAFRLLAD